MKKRILGLAVGAMAVIGALLYGILVSDRGKDEVNTGNQDPSGHKDRDPGNNKDSEEEPFFYDGDFTYVDNEQLLSVIEGEWTSTDGVYQLVIGNNYEIVIFLKGEKVIEDTLHYTYLQPGYVSQTEFSIDASEIDLEDRNNPCEIVQFYHKADENRGMIYFVLKNKDGGEETIEFR